MDEPALLPARMLNEFAYCPRLAYLEWVQGEFAHSADTLDGALQHRRVDKPGGKLPAAEALTLPSPGGRGETTEDEDSAPPEQIHARSVPLSAPGEGLTAVIDLLEGDGADGTAPLAVTPVDYKRGKIPDTPERAWEPERVQLCAQGLILRERGYACDGGVLYYVASKTRVEIPFDEKLVGRTRELIAGMRAMVGGGLGDDSGHAGSLVHGGGGESGQAGSLHHNADATIPPPLVDSPKCPRCSLVGICLPDETHMLAEARPIAATDAERETTATAAEPLRVRPLVPGRDDAKPLYVQDQGAIVGKSGEELHVRTRDGKTLAEARLAETSHVSLYGNVQVSTQALGALLDAQIPVAYFSYGGWFRGTTLGLPSKNIELRRNQFAAERRPEVCLAIARKFTWAKIENQRTILRRNGTPSDVELDDLKQLARKALEINALPSLLGIEGAAARVYFGAFPSMLKPRGGDTEDAAGFSFSFEKRNRRPPEDPVNALLSFAYSLLAKEFTIACWISGFDPYLGFYHQPRFGRPALALDLMEEFRPLIAESVVLTAINTGVIGAGDFLRRGGAVALKPDGRKRFLQAYERRMDNPITHALFGYPMSYRRVLELQARLLGRHLAGELPEYPSFVVR